MSNLKLEDLDYNSEQVIASRPGKTGNKNVRLFATYNMIDVIDKNIRPHTEVKYIIRSDGFTAKYTNPFKAIEKFNELCIED